MTYSIVRLQPIQRTNETRHFGSAGIVLNWGSGGFVPTGSSLLLSDVTATNNVTFANPINFGAAQRTVDVANGAAAVDATLSGFLTGTGGLTKAGDGVLALTGTNLYTGQTVVSGGVLRLATANALPGGTAATGGLDNLNFAGGAVELAAGDFTRAVGTAAGQVQFTGTGGFAAVGANRTVNLGGAAAPLSPAASSRAARPAASSIRRASSQRCLEASAAPRLDEPPPPPPGKPSQSLSSWRRAATCC